MSAVGIVTCEPNWYPRQAMDKVLVAIQERIRNRRVITYGHGQGGYGALKFAAALRASTALAFSPQWSINPADVGAFDTRYTRYFDKALGNGRRIEQEEVCNCALVFFDKMEKSDARNAVKLAALDGVHLVVTPFSEEETLRVITQGRGAAALIRSYTSATPPGATDLRKMIRVSRQRSPIYLDYMVRRLIPRMSHSRSRSLAFVTTLLGKSNENRFYSAVLAHVEGNASLAEADLRKTNRDMFDNVDLLSWWRLSRELGFRNAEVAVASQIFERHPSDLVACLQAIDTLIRARDIAGAKGELARLARHSDATNRIALFVKYSIALRTTGVLETLLLDELPFAVRVHILFSLVDLYQLVGEKANALRKLKDLTTICAGGSSESQESLSFLFGA